MEIYDGELNTWKLQGGMNYRRLGGGVGVIQIQQHDTMLYEMNPVTNATSTSLEDTKIRPLSKLVDL